jgi:hypothetical protein
MVAAVSSSSNHYSRLGLDKFSLAHEVSCRHCRKRQQGSAPNRYSIRWQQ